jgi:hypothetical protein
VLGANDRIRLGIIGAGARGTEILREALACENVECAGAADVYSRRLEEVARHRSRRQDSYLDYRRLLEDKSDRRRAHRHSAAPPREHFIAALDAGKHVYQEKTMAFTVEHAKKMRAAWQRAGKRVRARSATSGSPAARSRRRPVPPARADGQGHRHPSAHVPQHAPRQAAVGAARLSRHDARKHPLEIVPGRGAGARFRRPPLRQLALLLGLLRRQRLREHVPPAGLLVQGLGLRFRARHHDRRHLPVEGRPRSARHHDRRHGTRRGDSVHLGFRFRQRPPEVTEA